MKCIWQMDGDKVKGFKCEFTPIEMLSVVCGLKYIIDDTERHPKDREHATHIYNKIMLGRYHDEAEQTEPQTCDNCRFDSRYGIESICTECSRHYSDCYAPKDEQSGKE